MMKQISFIRYLNRKIISLKLHIKIFISNTIYIQYNKSPHFWGFNNLIKPRTKLNILQLLTLTIWYIYNIVIFSHDKYQILENTLFFTSFMSRTSNNLERWTEPHPTNVKIKIIFKYINFIKPATKRQH